MAKKEQAPVKYYELAEKRSSGFILDGTKGTQFQQELTAPAIRWISSSGRTYNPETKGFKEIRYLSGCDILDPEEQKKRGYTPRPFEDKIPMEAGFISVAREGNTVTLYDYLEQVNYNLDAQNRPDGATATFKEVKLDKQAVDLLDEDEFITKAKGLVYELRLNTGDKKAPYKYNIDRINSICRLVDVWDETPERKLILLLQKATQSPKEFLETVSKAEQTVITEVTHAMELNLIMFEGNTAQYSEGNKIIVNLTGDKLKSEQKAEKLAFWLTTAEGNTSLTELRAKLEVAKGKLL